MFDGFKNLFSDSNSPNSSSQDPEDEEDELDAELVRIDADSSGGLGGTTEDAFGPLVRPVKQECHCDQPLIHLMTKR